MKVEPSKLFKRKNFDLYVEVPISFKIAAMGGKIKVPIVDETIEYTIPEGTGNGKVFYVRGKGIKSSRGTGDLYIVVKVEVPTRLTKAQRKALLEFDEQTEIKQTPLMREFKDNVESMYGENPYED